MNLVNLDGGTNMIVTHFTHEGYHYRQIVSRAYTPLRELRELYKKDGRHTWINQHDGIKWQLTVQLDKEDPR